MGQTRKRTKQPGGVAVFQTGGVRGEIVLEQSAPHTVTIHATFFSLPAGKHGFHIHQYGNLL